jgi:LPPG:FO 2-phospho-L-lactate transferase
LKIVALAGGTGSAKLLRGLKEAAGDFTVVSNVGDNFWRHGLYIAPDVDIAVYTLAGMEDPQRGWGLRGDTFNALAQLGRMGEETWFNLGDRDLATHLFRTERLAQGRRLGDITTLMCERLGVTQRVIPCTDDRLETHIVTRTGAMHLQEFWVKFRGEPDVLGVEYRGAEGAKPEQRAVEALESADRIVICPANPVTSIMPILAVNGIRQAIQGSRARKIAVSPMVGGSPVTGPAGKLMTAIGSEPSSLGVAKLYRGLADCILVDPADAGSVEKITKEGIRAEVRAIVMSDREAEVRLARETLSV